MPTARTEVSPVVATVGRFEIVRSVFYAGIGLPRTEWLVRHDGNTVYNAQGWFDEAIKEARRLEEEATGRPLGYSVYQVDQLKTAIRSPR